MPNFVREIKRYKKQTINAHGTVIVTDNPNKRGESHLMDCLRYLCAYEPRWHEPPKVAVEQPWWMEWNKKRQKGDEDNAVYLSPRSYTDVFYA